MKLKSIQIYKTFFMFFFGYNIFFFTNFVFKYMRPNPKINSLMYLRESRMLSDRGV